MTTSLNKIVPLTSSSSNGSTWSSPGLSISSLAVSPLVFFSVLDHQTRRKASQASVAGVLLGSLNVETGSTHVYNSFPLNTITSENGNVTIDEEYFHQMMTLHYRVNKKEVFVGWYSTDKELNDSTNSIHEKLSSLVGTHLPFVHLLVDAQSLKSLSQISAKAFVGTELKMEGVDSSLGYMFEQVQCNTIYLDGDKSALDLILKSQETPNLSAAVTSELEALETSLRKISSLLDSIQVYVKDVVAGKTKSSPAIGRFLMDTFHLMPQLNPAEFEKLFQGHLQDVLMVLYLANLTRSQLAISERLHQMG